MNGNIVGDRGRPKERGQFIPNMLAWGIIVGASIMGATLVASLLVIGVGLCYWAFAWTIEFVSQIPLPSGWEWGV